MNIPESGSLPELPHGIRRFAYVLTTITVGPPYFTLSEWRATLSRWRTEGWQLGRTSWHETQFHPATAQVPAYSVISATAQLTNTNRNERAILRGELSVEWKTGGNSASPPVPTVIGADKFEWLTRVGPPPFTENFTAELKPQPGSSFVDPLLLSDLDGDGFSEIVLVGANKLFRNRGGSFQEETLAVLPPGRVFAAVLADLNSDGRADLLVAGADGLTLFENDGHGKFPGAGKLVWRAPSPLKHPQVITVGDIDGDGDLDVWLAQYKVPYQSGQFPTPYFDANDGFPSYLLRNDGAAGFTDITNGSNLVAKRFRRTYSASLVDLDGDGDLDLVNVSDFAGVDIFLNDGQGHFTDVTSGLGDARHLFGMAHALADMNGDGRIDLFALGMDSPTAIRLDALALSRPGFAQPAAKRAAMIYGNRLFLGGPNGLQMAPFADQLAHAGWSWGASLFDFDNDGQIDVAIANGHETRPSVKDYERQFWLHDIFVGNSSNDTVANLYFGSASARRVAEHASYGGWQDNVLFQNLGGNKFADVAFLLGVAVPEDSQNLASDDVDGDGRLDLVVTTFGTWPERRQHLRIFHNATPDVGNWIDFRLDASLRPWTGARVRVETVRGTQTRWLVTGDSYRSEHAPAAHFGLGDATTITRAEIFWLDGSRTDLSALRINQWHQINP
ncbi:MAG: CRTAC1 family protein [Verrucomicrobia bacterium]|nr:CRTAC1 family protein [Verrucomicrobiota bacterium]